MGSTMRKLFGTDGVRGIANIDPMTSEMAMKLGRAAAHIFKNKAGRHRIVIGKDTRLSCYMLESALTSGICSMGVDVLLVGPLPTPAVAFLARSLRVDAGVMISASHNPFEDNGIKFFSRDGLKLPDEMEHQIESLIFSGEIDNIRPTAAEIGKVFRIDDVEGRYIEFVKNSLPKGLDFQRMKIVVDCANGAAYKVAPMVLRELGAEVIVLSDDPSGTNINLNCGALYPEELQKKVIETQADVGIAHDGDADRAVFVDERGHVVDGDALLVAFALALHQEKALKGETLVSTLMSNMGMDLALRSRGIQVVRTPVGDRYVLERMIKDGYNLGGEQSGHVIFLDYNTTGDGLISALQLLSLMKRTGKKVSELAACMTALPQVLKNVRVQKKLEISEIPELQKAIADCEEKLRNNGRILIRYSGTEPLLRIMIEGEEQTAITAMADQLAEIVQKKIGLSK
ncbi:MAG: phosphoglucosamine mutase [Candidatus Manganitrophus sp.]|nr:phosphoglucosamine mutase [Candidatus Manganitrophus sp.]WDT70556.1 MAG: phosphoglucosamine mutase [Candidatus Manganitrophus sp.]WDT82191.1 MAG: phosphoglucosamine mutase [Candidatus Manganitrophus sp.]